MNLPKIPKPKCQYCLKPIVAKWNERKNGQCIKVDKPATQAMHLKCWKENGYSWKLPTDEELYERYK